VVIWLGVKEEDDNGLGFKTVRSYADRWDQGRFVDDRIEAKRAESIDAAVHAVFWRPWFERLWVFQEAVLAKEATVFYGDQKIGWEYLYKASAWPRISGLVLEISRSAYGRKAYSRNTKWSPEKMNHNDDSHLPRLFELIFARTGSKFDRSERQGVWPSRSNEESKGSDRRL
jgi:hypothetical protein